MAGFSLSADELERVCHRMRVQSDRVHDEAGRAGSGQTGPMDFGGADHAELARLYAEVFEDVIPRMLHEFQSATQSMSDRLRTTLAAYLAIEDDAARSLR